MKIDVSSYRSVEHRDAIMFNVTLTDLHRITEAHGIPAAIAQAVKEHIKEKEMGKIMEEARQLVQLEIEKAVQAYVKEQTLAIVKTLDLEGIAKIAAIQAAKELGKDVAK